MVNLTCPQAQRPATPLLGLSLLLYLPSNLLHCRRPPPCLVKDQGTLQGSVILPHRVPFPPHHPYLIM